MHGITISDLHSGDAYGLTCPANVPEKKHGKAREFAKILFDWYAEKLVKIGKVDAVICPGELTEGPGHKDTIELLTVDMEEQAEWCAELLMMIPSDTYYLTYASKYHSGVDMRTDNLVVKELLLNQRKAEIRGMWRLQLEEVKVNASHHVGGSSVPHTFVAQIMKAGTNDVLRGWYRDYEPADLYFRAHTHAYGVAGNDRLTVYNCPSMKWPLGQYGLKIDRPWYAMGFLEWWIEGTSWAVEPHIFRYKLPEENYVEVGCRG